MSRNKSYTIESYQTDQSADTTASILRLCSDRHDRRDIVRALQNQPEFVYFAKMGKEAIALCTALLEQDHLEASLTLFVQRRYRERGIAGDLFARTVNRVRAKGYDPNFIAFYPRSDQSLLTFLTHYDMQYLYSDLCMVHQGLGPVPALPLAGNAEIISYTDAFYPEMVRLRNLGINEDQALKALPIRKLFHEHDPTYRDWMAAQASNSFVLMVDGRMHGFAMAASDGEVRSIVVDPDYRGRGYASALVAYALTKQFERKRPEIYLWVAEKNQVARHIYAKLGFVRIETFDCAFGKPPLLL